MTRAEREEKIEELIVENVAYYGGQLGPAQLRLWVADLADLEPEAVAAAYRALRMDARREKPPLPGEVRTRISGGTSDHSIATELAGRIWALIGSKGYTWEEYAADWPEPLVKALGPAAYEAVQQMGGWGALCRGIDVKDRGTWIAQTRDLLTGILQRQRMHGPSRPTAVPAPKGRPAIAMDELTKKMPGHPRKR